MADSAPRKIVIRDRHYQDVVDLIDGLSVADACDELRKAAVEFAGDRAGEVVLDVDYDCGSTVVRLVRNRMESDEEYERRMQMAEQARAARAEAGARHVRHWLTTHPEQAAKIVEEYHGHT